MRAAMRGTGSNAGPQRAASTVQRVMRGSQRWHEGAGGGMWGQRLTCGGRDGQHTVPTSIHTGDGYLTTDLSLIVFNSF